MGLNKKRKQHLSLITNHSLKSCKKQNVNNKIQQKKEILKTQREEEDYLNKYKDYSLNSSSNEWESNDFNLNSYIFDNKREIVIEDNGKEEDTCKGLRDDEGRVLLENNKRILKLI